MHLPKAAAPKNDSIFRRLGNRHWHNAFNAASQQSASLLLLLELCRQGITTLPDSNLHCFPCMHVLPACLKRWFLHCTCRCLCLPVVLYETAKQASEYDVDVFGVLRQCRQQYPDFQTQWAAATPTACPTMLLQGDLIDRLARMGSAPILSSDGAPTWAWSNLLQAQQFAELHPAGSQAMTDLADYILGRWLPVCMILSLLCATLLFFAVHKCVLMRISTVYKVCPALC